MPQLEASSAAVSWPRDELCIGVVGVAPWATVDFLRALYGLIDASKDWHYPRVIVDANTKIPSRGRHLELGETDPSPAIRATIEELARSGAGVVVVPCNTAHLLFDRWGRSAPVPVPHIMRAASQRVATMGGTAVAVLQSGALRSHGAYGDILEETGLVHVPLTDDEAARVATWIGSVKLRGRPEPSEIDAFVQLAQGVTRRGADTLLLGCTELSSFAHAVPQGVHVVDSNVELARAAAVAARCALRGAP